MSAADECQLVLLDKNRDIWLSELGRQRFNDKIINADEILLERYSPATLELQQDGSMWFHVMF